jgi:spoIIIJ-associated protein
MQSIEIQARTVDEAVALALSRLGRTFDEVEIEVLNPGSPGVLGVGAENAFVRVTVRQPGVRPRMPQPQPQAYYPNPNMGNMRPQPGPNPLMGAPMPQPMPGAMPPMTVPVGVNGINPNELANIGRDVITNILRRMRINARPQIEFHQPIADPTSGEENESPLVTINLLGNDLAVLIGRRGEALTDLQYIFNLIMNKRTHSWGRVMIDVEGYRTRRKDNLINLARRMADQVATYRQPITLEPMPAYERRLIHLALLDHPYVRTESFGESQERKITIFPK